MPNIAMITGASSGIGLEIAKRLGAQGFHLAISSSSSKIIEAKHALEKTGATVHAYQADASTYEGVENFWQFTKALGHPIDIAVLNAGIGLGGAFIDNSFEDDKRVIDINITGTIHMAKRVVHAMVPRKTGKILIVSSISATTPTPFETVYGPSKAFGFMFAESLREELRGTGVSVTALLPGATNTQFHKNAGMASSKLDQGPKNDVELVAQQGVEALMAGLDHVVGGDAATQRQFLTNRQTAEHIKAERHAELCRLQAKTA